MKESQYDGRNKNRYVSARPDLECSVNAPIRPRINIPWLCGTYTIHMPV